ncbi:ABC transporter ATP-binding protein [Geoalkalibacter halelectricus]|uniref:ABC transporter ATP-binding protein n=1 Tax=Geoalkalibacter halelectricus TaxID=2847045 RepID=A0ABY5ZKP6_9BACT|nr:ABC transporter ATP-binding protein [Geoalkalibacter halelectricus]MDO3378943.1 ABC transporter ATP-binding protein [Geoalkalibacter halelectricus]UWZ79034.1 ABC transporter ATP-binding protein [Geoalkalibacter halelectricus]
MSQTVLELDGISQAYGSHLVVDNLSLRLEKGRIGCLLGASGCGKTTVLRTISGFESLLAGEIRLNGRTVSRPGQTLPPAKRGIGMVFQDYALFPHLSIFDNVAFGLRGFGRAEKIVRVNEMLELVGLKQEQQKYPHEISGGQQQRVALARALAPRPDLLLLDEPFSNLDVTLRERLSLEVRDILKAYGATALFVTHNQQEAFAVADQIGVMSEGRMLQWAGPHELYHRPTDTFVARFVGEGVLLPGVVRTKDEVETGLGLLKGDFSAATEVGGAVSVLVRPEDVVHDDDWPIKAEVVRRNFRGASILYTLRLAGGELVQAQVPSHCNHAIGEHIGIRSDVRHLVLFPRV